QRRAQGAPDPHAAGHRGQLAGQGRRARRTRALEGAPPRGRAPPGRRRRSRRRHARALLDVDARAREPPPRPRSRPPASRSAGPRRRPDTRMAAAPVTYVATRFLLLRLLGVVYLTAFVIAARQGPALLGPEGLLPAEDFLGNVAAALGGSRVLGFARLPS